MKKILVIEDDKEIAAQLISLFEGNGYACAAISDFAKLEQQLSHALTQEISLVLLDLSLPNIQGEYLLKKLRTYSDVPIIIVTSKNTEMDELLCMSLGADDFISKPYNPSILLLRIEAVLKRTSDMASPTDTYGDLKLNTANAVLSITLPSHEVKKVELSKNEMRILHYLIQHHGAIVSRNELIGFLWDTEEFIDDNTLTVNINRVRSKLKETGTASQIKTKRGIGYILE